MSVECFGTYARAPNDASPINQFTSAREQSAAVGAW